MVSAIGQASVGLAAIVNAVAPSTTLLTAADCDDPWFQTICQFLESRGDWWRAANSTAEIEILLQRANLAEGYDDGVRFFQMAF